ncbi:MAG TPA: XRE family transcriptional regulator [Cyanobacteria bacterium UBA11372]|nr:XRE family transcriptional regulator [Cyanobacteria bacterium UBA11372]
MGAVGKALKQVLETHAISQNKLATVMGVKPFVVYRWYYEKIDPRGETILNIAEGLQQIEPAAAKKFFMLYLGKFLEDGDRP